ncbi:dethiobiotin synthase [Capnocytophaga canimorsus]|uniref:dethiobiotin synthase n=1 Tax=Capnocytophaga canimorsus TaxID=28188 RepID=UPI001AD24FCE|nr:dethiobiotin synthase [Capnocytophaga canimorsus]GIM58809.1 ATP-dependent dethiobiotin synthetase BioD [Capnocytophaga canimorsus]
MKKHTYFVTGISTEVGKTIVAAIITQALKADYWKPIQSGDLENSDTHKVKHWISNPKTFIHPNAYALKVPASPHLSAKLDNTTIEINKIIRPKTENHLVIEGAGGLLVPLNQTNTIADLILPSDRIIIVSRHYLGSINHTLLTVEAIKNRNLTPYGIVFSGKENPSSETVILQKSGVRCLGRVDEEPYFDKDIIRHYAQKWSLSDL